MNNRESLRLGTKVFAPSRAGGNAPSGIALAYEPAHGSGPGCHMKTTLTVNGQKRAVDLDPATPLLWVLRDTLGLTGTKFGCGAAQCGACAVHLDGEAVRSCVTPLARAAGREVVTIEGLSDAVGRAKDIAAGDPPPALLIIHGADDKMLTPAIAVTLHDALKPLYQEAKASRRLQLTVTPGLEHAWADTASVETLRSSIAAWFHTYLSTAGAPAA